MATALAMTLGLTGCCLPIPATKSPAANALAGSEFGDLPALDRRDIPVEDMGTIAAAGRVICHLAYDMREYSIGSVPVAKIIVNGNVAGIIKYLPEEYRRKDVRIDITKHLKKGENLVKWSSFVIKGEGPSTATARVLTDAKGVAARHDCVKTSQRGVQPVAQSWKVYWTE